MLPFETMFARISTAAEFAKQEIHHLIPSIQLAGGGPVIKSVFFVTEAYLGEVRMVGRGEDFDFTHLRPIENFRVRLGTHEIARQQPPPEPASPGSASIAPVVEKIVYDTASIQLNHNPGLQSDISYVGNGREHWLSLVRRAFPLSLLLE